MRGIGLKVTIISVILVLTLFHSISNQDNNNSLGSHTFVVTANDTKTPIKHVINIFFENHSFDNFFGIYPEDFHGTNSSLMANLSVPVNLLGNQSDLSKLTAVPNGSFGTTDPIEGWAPYHLDWNHGAMNGFLNGSGRQSLSYFTASQMSPLWDLAEEYGLADNYFAPVISESTPNHLYYFAGYSPVINDYGPPPYIPFSESVMGELSHFGISWAWYVQPPTFNFPDWRFFSGIDHYSGNLRSWYSFEGSLANDTLPSVSWVFTQGINIYSGAPPNNVDCGELWLLHVINLIEESPEWNSTAIFITWDEFGGYYDQVSPPVLDGEQLGFRIPLIVVSPFSKEDYISSTLMTHTSIIAFIDYNWKIPALNQFVSVSNIPLDFFCFPSNGNDKMFLRGPYNIAAVGGFVIPSTITYHMNETMLDFDYASHFPVTPQIPFGNLTYSRYGSSNLTLSMINSSLYIHRDVTYTPFTLSSYFLVFLIMINGVAASAAIWRKKHV